MQIVKQKDKYDCGIACLAMMLDKPYEEIIQQHFPKHDFNKDGLYISELVSVIKLYGHDVFINSGFHMKSSGILFVPSLNTLGSGHFVFWDGLGKLFDPSNDNQYSISVFPLVVQHILILDRYNKKDLINKYTDMLDQLK